MEPYGIVVDYPHSLFGMPVYVNEMIEPGTIVYAADPAGPRSGMVVVHSMWDLEWVLFLDAQRRKAKAHLCAMVLGAEKRLGL